MRLPEGYEATLTPRSSTFKKFGIIQTNGWGVIDNSYCGENDVWGMPTLAMRETTIHEDDRIYQFRIADKMPEVEFEAIEFMEDATRGGFGSTETNQIIMTHLTECRVHFFYCHTYIYTFVDWDILGTKIQFDKCKDSQFLFSQQSL